MNTDFPQSKSNYLKADLFQDSQVLLTLRGWEYVGNEDKKTKKGLLSWKDRLKYCLMYSYPEFATDPAGEKRLGSDGNPFKNKYYRPEFPKGYTIKYHFEEGELESGSNPLWEKFCQANPKPGERVIIWKTGKAKETKWFVNRADKIVKGDLPTIQLDKHEENTPF